MEYHSAIKKELWFVATQMELKGIMSGEMSQAQEGRHFMILLPCRRQYEEERTVVISVSEMYWREVSWC